MAETLLHDKNIFQSSLKVARNFLFQSASLKPSLQFVGKNKMLHSVSFFQFRHSRTVYLPKSVISYITIQISQFAYIFLTFIGLF